MYFSCLFTLYFKFIILGLLVGFVTLILRIADLLVTHSRLIELY